MDRVGLRDVGVMRPSDTLGFSADLAIAFALANATLDAVQCV